MRPSARLRRRNHPALTVCFENVARALDAILYHRARCRTVSHAEIARGMNATAQRWRVIARSLLGHDSMESSKFTAHRGQRTAQGDLPDIGRCETGIHEGPFAFGELHIGVDHHPAKFLHGDLGTPTEKISGFCGVALEQSHFGGT